MTKRTLMWMMMALLAVMPASLAAADGELPGRWMLSTVTVQGQSEDAPANALVFEFGADNTLKMYQEGQEMESGTYRVEGDQIVMTSASDGETESVGYAIDGDTLTLKMEIQPGVEMTMAFSRTEAGNRAVPMNFVALDASDLHGKWDLTRMEQNGQGEDIPAGMFAIEFLADGTAKMYQQGQEAGSGNYTVEGDQITLSVEGEPESPAATFSIDGNTLTVVSEVQPGTTMSMVFTRSN
ncbi:lipocalin family protein [Phycisphaeraceae bacterium D3-23]